MERVAARLCLLFTPELVAGDAWAVLAAALRGGVDLVQWRVKRRDAAGLARCRETSAALGGVPVVVNDQVDLAVASGAAGAHVGQQDLPAAQARALLGPHRLLGVSTRDATQVTAAARAGADYVGFGPCFASTTKGHAAGLPPGSLRAALAAAALPVFAIGGIDAHNLPRLVAEGCTRIALSSAILHAADPAATAAALRQQLG